MKCQFHTDGTIPAATENWVWVFGSNLATNNGAGAAAVAVTHFSRPRFEMEDYYSSFHIGYNNLKSYGIPTKNAQLRPMRFSEIKSAINEFISFVQAHSNYNFFITRVGCGYAGYSDEQIAPLFKTLVHQTNISFPITWKEYLCDNSSTSSGISE